MCTLPSHVSVDLVRASRSWIPSSSPVAGLHCPLRTLRGLPLIFWVAIDVLNAYVHLGRRFSSLNLAHCACGRLLEPVAQPYGQAQAVQSLNTMSLWLRGDRLMPNKSMQIAFVRQSYHLLYAVITCMPSPHVHHTCTCIYKYIYIYIYIYI